MNDQNDFELTACDKNIKIRAEAVMFILVCSIASFSFLTLALIIMSHTCMKKICLSVASVLTNLLVMYVI